MSMTPVGPARTVPDCYGKSWDKDSTECAGGNNPLYRDRNGNRVPQPRCDYFDSCGAHQQTKAGFVPLGNLIRPTPPVAQQSAPMGPQQWWNNVRGPLAQQQVRTPQVPAPPPPVPTYPAYAPQAHPTYPIPSAMPVPPMQQPHFPAPSYQLNYMMPGYLTQPEQRVQGESVWAVLGRSIVRALGKSFGHTVSHFFDHTILK